MELSLQLEIVAEAALAMLLGGLIGLERETRNKPAGFRTHMLVAGAAALLIGMSEAMLVHFGPGPFAENMRNDPIRVLEAIITGVSFLGAGTIFRGGTHGPVGGLTTAASLLMSAAIGIAVALNQLVTAFALTLLVLIVLRGLGIIERRIATRRLGQPTD